MDSSTRRLRRQVIITLILVCCAIEVSLSLADWGAIATPRLRQTIYEYAGFWPGLVGTWRPNYPTQPFLMFLTYSFLHSGLIHLIVNMATLWSLSAPVVARVGLRGFTLLYGLAIVGGGLGYVVISPSASPMIGASGALFGLAGGLLAWNYLDRFTAHQGLWPVVQAMVLLIALNVILWLVTNGNLAWQTHLGGFITGWLFASVIDPRPRNLDS